MTKEVVVVRLEPEVLMELERKVPPPIVTSQTTDLVAGYQLGVQMVLKLLRDGYAISR